MKVTMKVEITDSTSTRDVLAQVNCRLRQCAQKLDQKLGTQQVGIADNMWRIRSNILDAMQPMIESLD